VSSSPRFGKPAIVIFVIAVVVYVYQTGNFKIRPFKVQETVDTGFNFTRSKDFSADTDKADAVVAAFKHAWAAYERDAMGDDEYHPISKSGSNLTDSGVGYAIIDAIDTMQVIGLQEQYSRTTCPISVAYPPGPEEPTYSSILIPRSPWRSASPADSTPS